MSETSKNHCAIVLPGAVAKGAYEAGAVHAIAETGTQVDRIVATSSGALNGVALAAGIRSGNVTEMTEMLNEAWIKLGGWQDSLKFSPLSFITGRGASNRNGLLGLLQSIVTPCTSKVRNEVELRIIVAPLRGVIGSIGPNPATTYERVLSFTGEDFDSAEGLRKIFDATTAACAFPGLFEPVEIEGLGPCIDGGTVNNAPIKYALDEGDVSRVIMPVPFPSVMEVPQEPLRGLNLFNHLVDILINERLYRDLKDAHAVNREIARIETLVGNGVLTKEQAAIVRKLASIRPVQIIEVRPENALEGNSFSGFFSRDERIRLVAEGRKAGLRALAPLKA